MNSKNLSDKELRTALLKLATSYIKSNGLTMSKKINSGGLFSLPTYDTRTVYSFESMYKLLDRGFSVESDMGTWLFNALLTEDES